MWWAKPEMKRTLNFLAKVAVSTLLLWLCYRRVDVAGLRSQLGTIRWSWVALFFALLASNTLLASLKWRLLLAADGIRQPLRRLFASHLTGAFFSLFLPSTIGGDAYRIADIGHHSARTANTAASVLVDRLTGFIALATYGLLFPLLMRDLIPNWSNRFLLLPGAAMALLLGGGVVLVEQRLLRLLVSWLPVRIGAPVMRILDKILSSVKVYASRPLLWVYCMVLSFIFQFFAIAAVYSLSRALGLGLALLPFCCFVPFITLMEMIPISIFGVGLRDKGYVWFMEAVGRSRADAASLSILYVAVTLAYVALGGIIFVLRRQRSRNMADVAAGCKSPTAP